MRFAIVVFFAVLSNTARAELPEVLFTRHDGLSSAGKVVHDWSQRAALHGLGVEGDAKVDAWVADPGQGRPGTLARQLEVEASLQSRLRALVAELPPAPRHDEVLADPKNGFYLSPDVSWRDQLPREPTPEHWTEAQEAARGGTLDTFLQGLVPRHPQYARLVSAAERYREICREAWQPIAPVKVGKKKGWVPDAAVATAFQKRLAAEGFFAGAPTGVWDAATEDALTRFRAARQVPLKGLDDPDLYAALNVPCDQRLLQLQINVRRWRVSAWRQEPTYVEVNIAAQELRYVRDHALVMTQRTIVGATKWYFDKDLKRRLNVHSTPILHDHISRIVVNPTWAVPPRIAKNEIDVQVAADPTYLERNRMQLVESERGRTYIQSPGPGNALGVIKILFPNSESVYLHDTPKKGPFKLAVRALSHGCVRVQNAVDFGVALLKADAEVAGQPFDEEAIRSRAGRGGSVIIDLRAQVPVFLEYYTASVDDAGVVRFHPDIYAYDAEVGVAPL